MINIDDKTKCCGCTACASICPKQCIEMTADDEGFLYPVVDETLCVNCDLCVNTCPVINIPRSEQEPSAVVVRNKTKDILMDSTSGGAFSAIATALILKKKAIVYGAAFDSDFLVVHTSCDNICDLYKFRGSKFVQSDLRGIYNDIRNKLKSDKTVLFSGTPCQVAGLKNFLKGKYTENLYCIDIVCRGVPSPKVWHEYLSYIRKKYSSRIKKVKFRNKTYGYHSSTMLIEFDNGKVYKKSGRVDPMMKLFTREMCSRPSCAECVFKTKERISDLTLFDCKRYTELTGANDDDMGYTAVLVQSDKGSTMMRLADENIFSLSIDAEELISKCGIMVCGKAQPNQKRNEFFKKLGNDSIDKVLQSICPVTIKDRGIELSKNMLYSTGLIKIARKIKKHEKIEIK